MPVIPIIICSDSQEEQSKISQRVAIDFSVVIEVKFNQLTGMLSQYPDATIVTSWLQPCAELKEIIKLTSLNSMPLIVFIRKFNMNTFNALHDPEGYLLLPLTVDCEFETWIGRAKQVRDNQIKLTQEIADLEQKIIDKKWIDKVKGLLQKHHGLNENQAHDVLRKAAMDNGLPMVKIARNLISTLQKTEKY
ncbi:putative two-component response regulatory protein [Photobacterium sp. SKA34]|uniref:ANTAR domain-containing response regulator n=1 Tax=Photobacterium sp. SKA34 TaxID=121723 RepID=UPI00006AEB49|nr:ANTAR domain-containing protein [Photobacterium sp. SKA34]EAR57192.1 putative two-component response regulatory protein [Photobacterium sp. SKA34]